MINPSSGKTLNVIHRIIEQMEHKLLPTNILKKINFIKINFFEIFNKVEFYIFHHCLNKKISDFLQLFGKIQSIDSLINYHQRLMKEIFSIIGIKDGVIYSL